MSSTKRERMPAGKTELSRGGSVIIRSYVASGTQTRSDLLRVEANRVEHAIERDSPADVRLHDEPRHAKRVTQVAQSVDDHVRGAVGHSVAQHVVVGQLGETLRPFRALFRTGRPRRPYGRGKILGEPAIG